MTDSRENPDPGVENQPKTSSKDREGRKSLSMHEGVPVWYDCCSCEAEPYWLEAIGETEIEPSDCEGND
jgi:hypothetical protein